MILLLKMFQSCSHSITFVFNPWDLNYHNNNNNNNNNNSVISVNIQRFNSVLLHDSFAEDVPVM